MNSSKGSHTLNAYLRNLIKMPILWPIPRHCETGDLEGTQAPSCSLFPALPMQVIHEPLLQKRYCEPPVDTFWPK